MSFNVFEVLERLLQYRNNWNEVESQLFEKLTTKRIKGEGKHMHGRLEKWKERIKTNFLDQDVLYDMYCNGIAVLKTESVYKISKNYHPKVYVEECKYTDAKYQQSSMLNNSDDDSHFVV